MSHTKRLPLISLLVVSASAALPLFLNAGFLNTRGGGDSPFLLFRLHQLYTALTQGVFPVRWMPDAAYGLGYPFFSYYAALPLYIAAFFKLIGFSFVLSLKLTQLAGFGLAAFAMYGWMRSVGTTRLTAWVAAALYTFAPFHLVNVFVRGDSLNEFWAFVFYPLCLWSVQKIRNNQYKIPNTEYPLLARRLLGIGYSVLPLALSYAALVFTHNISALIFSPFLGLYILAVSLQPSAVSQQPSAVSQQPSAVSQQPSAVSHQPSAVSQQPSAVSRQPSAVSQQPSAVSRQPSGIIRQASLFTLHCSLGLLLGLALSAFFWLPALRESDFGQLAPVTQGFFHYSNHFRGRNLVQPSLLFNFDVGSPDTTPFAMGLAQTGLIAAALLILAFKFLSALRNPQPATLNPFTPQPSPPHCSVFIVSLFTRTPALWGGVVSFALATFMITRYSEPLWASLPLLPFVQFPWRFLSVQSLFASALIAFSFEPLALSRQPSAVSRQPSAVSRQPSAVSQQPSAVSQQPSAVSHQPSAVSDQPSAVSHQPSAVSQQPSAVSPQLIADNQPPATSNQPPALLRLLPPVLCLLVCALSIAGLKPDFVPLADSDITAERLQLYEYFTGNIGTTINYEYLPQWTRPRPYSSEEFIFGGVSLKVLNGKAEGERLLKRAASQTWLVTVQSDSASVAVPLLFWPGWQARADGRPLSLYPAPNGLGWIAFDLPRGEHRLDLTLGDTDLRRAATLISIVTLIIILIPASRLTIDTFRAYPPRRLALHCSLLIASLAIAVIAARLVDSRTQPLGAAAMDFDQQGYLHSSAVRFGNGDLLLGYNYSADTLAPGDPLGLALAWQSSGRASYRLDLVSPAEHLLGFPATFASVTGPAAPHASALLRLPPDLPTGLYFIRLNLYQDNLLAPALTFNNQPRGALYLRPIRVIAPTAQPPLNPTTQPITLASLTAAQPSADQLKLALGWQITAPLPANYILALRLHDTYGVELAALDTPPTGGLYPTSAWRVGEIITDHFEFDLPPGLPPGDYPLTLTFYRAADLAAVHTFSRPIRLSQWTPSPGAAPLHRFDQTLALQSLTLPTHVRAGYRFRFTALWAVAAPLQQDLTARWSLIGPNGQIAVVEDHPLASLPTSRWAAGALVLGRPSLKLPIAAPAGEYDLQVQLLDPSGDLLSPAVVVGQFAVAASDRTTQLPELQFTTEADLGPLTLAGYNIAITAAELSLTFYSQADEAMDTDYKYFVHLFNPADEFIVAQSDGFPLIATSDWEQDEVVVVTVALPLDSLEPGIVYNLGVGWYDPSTGNRLGDRVILSQGIAKP